MTTAAKKKPASKRVTPKKKPAVRPEFAGKLPADPQMLKISESKIVRRHVETIEGGADEFEVFAITALVLWQRDNPAAKYTLDEWFDLIVVGDLDIEALMDEPDEDDPKG